MRGLRGVGIQGLANPVFSAGCPGGANLASTILSYNPIAYWPLNELAGVTAINYGSLGAAANGAYSGPTLAQMAAPGGGLAPLFDGSNDLVNIYTAALDAAWPGAAATIVLWWKVYNAAVWTDAAARGVFRFLGDANNFIYFAKTSTANQLVAALKAGGTDDFIATTSITNTDWNLCTVTWTKAGDEFKWYNNAIQIGTTQTGIGTWYAGGITTGNCVLGASYVTGEPWKGYVAQSAVYSGVLTQPQIANIYAAGI